MDDNDGTHICGVCKCVWFVYVLCVCWWSNLIILIQSPASSETKLFIFFSETEKEETHK